MALSRIDLAVVVVVAVGMLWIEHEHRITIATPAAAEIMPPAGAVCPDTDDVPFSADCIKFINGGVLPDIHARMSAAVHALVVSSGADAGAVSHSPACPPSNENAPYSAACIRFLSGWFWQADPTEGPQD
jgi:hypothetical protein